MLEAPCLFMLAGVQYMQKNIVRIITLCNNIAKAEKLCLRDQVKIYRRRKAVILTEGKTLITPRDIPHAVHGEERYNMQFIVSF